MQSKYKFKFTTGLAKSMQVGMEAFLDIFIVPNLNMNDELKGDSLKEGTMHKSWIMCGHHHIGIELKQDNIF